MKFEPRLNHIEYWVSNVEKSMAFFESWLPLIGWYKLNGSAFSTGKMEIYLVEKPELKRESSVGPRHLCFQAASRENVDEVGAVLQIRGARILRGPLVQNYYSEGYYTVDFVDPDGYVLEVAFTPNMIL